MFIVVPAVRGGDDLDKGQGDGVLLHRGEYGSGELPACEPLLHKHRVAETEGQLEGRFKGLRAIHERHAEGRTLLAGLYDDLVAEGALHHSGSVLRRRFPGHHYIPGHGKARGPEAMLGKGFIHGRHAGSHAAADIGDAQKVEQALNRSILPRGAMERWENDVRCQGQKVCGQVPVHLQARELPGEARERLLKARRGAPGDLSLRGRSPLENDHMGLG